MLPGCGPNGEKKVWAMLTCPSMNKKCSIGLDVPARLTVGAIVLFCDSSA
jgi:hypothetical protein